MMFRDDCFRALAPHVADDVVVAVYSSAFDWMEVRPHPLNFFSTGAMGLGSAHALGLALAFPERRIVVLDGDGSLLMKLGSLVTIASAAPRNLIHFVCENGIYEANGLHPIPGKDTVDFAGMARAAGYRTSHSFDELSTFASNVGAVVSAEGPVFASLKVQARHPQERDYSKIHGPQVRDAFRRAVQVS